MITHVQEVANLRARIGELEEEVKRLKRNLAMHEKPVLCVAKDWPKCEEAIGLFDRAGIDVKVVDVTAAMMMDHYGEMSMPPYVTHECPGGSGLERIEELVRRAVPFVSTKRKKKHE